jgi:CheY-like chemotaxis protein
MNGEPIIILLVEDDLAHAEIVRRNFESCRVANRLIHVTDGQAALDYVNQRGDYSDPDKSPRPGVILLDLRLPKVDGLEVLQNIKVDPKHSSIPVVILTTSKAETDMVTAYALRANSYLVKPVDFMQFTQLMETFGYYWLAWNQSPHVPTPGSP